MSTGFGIDPDQGLSEADELRLVRLAADLGYHSAWTPSGADAAAFDRCLRWHQASGLPVGISAVPASGRPALFYAEQARRLWDATKGRFTLVVGSGRMPRPAQTMPPYLADLRPRLPAEMPLYVAALGPLMLAVAAELADGVALNWCTAQWVEWSRKAVAKAAHLAGRAVPKVVADDFGVEVGDPRGGAHAHEELPAEARRHVLLVDHRQCRQDEHQRRVINHVLVDNAHDRQLGFLRRQN